MPTATMSEDGVYRIDLRITRRVSIGDLASYLASSQRHIPMDRIPSITNSLSPKQIRDLVRTEMERRGTDYIDGWADQFGDTETRDRLTLAADLIRRAYPELAKAEDSQRPALENLVTTMCKHGNTPREDVTGDPIAECSKADGRTEWGAFGDDGDNGEAFYVYDCAVDVANEAARENVDAEAAPDDPYATWARICPDHQAQSADDCQECYAEEPEDDDADDEARCTDCSGKGCHWCHWTGRTDS
ncbi:hypothetical protein P3T27_006535 [Kitasatospora sp. MAA19]|uniref:hypothetical protein n=1 Tax=Kitasatospora sp. MAA19 TaxID=3035090 RepID=UPI002473ABE4|nr:hypothetical protein [Kitasatospora sp. MAA19]MDH6709786.1 hypothetical protein [Kitasatospora sp. MAA19]